MPTETPVASVTPAAAAAPAASSASAAAVAAAAAAPAAAAPAAEPAAAAPPAAGSVVAPAPAPVVEYALTLPKDAAVTPASIERTTAFAKAAGLSPAVAQQALELADQEVVAYRNQQKETFQTLATETWVTQLKADPAYGGEKFAQTQEHCRRAGERFLEPADREELNTSGLGNHPMLVKMFARIGAAMKNDGFVNGGAGDGGRDNSLEGIASRMYDKTKS